MKVFVIFLVIASSVLCTRQPRQISPFSTSSQCSFGRARELTECKWNLTNQEIIGRPSPLAWKLSSGKFTFFRGGPALDAAGDGDGGYLLVETSQKTPSASDSVVVPSILVNATPSDGRCIFFQYSMEGPTVERLRLAVQRPQVVREITNDTVVFAPRREMLWEQFGDSDGKWRTGAVLYSFGHPHHLVFEATVEDSSQSQRRLRGHIALDNIDLGTWKEEQEQLLLSSLPTGGQQETGGASGFGGAGSGGGFGNSGTSGGFGGFGGGGGGLPPPPGVQGEDSSLTNPCMGHCNFESSFCSWKNDQDDDFDWLLGKGSLSVVTGPSRDHITFNTGLPSRGYAYIDSGYPRRPGDRARLVSPLMDPTEADKPRCFRFWAHMYGNGIGTLKVLLLSGSSNTDFNVRELWSLTGEAGNTWHQAQLSVSSTSSYHVAIEATIGRNRLGDIAIDDVSFQQGSCPNTPQASAPADRQGDCNFETDECGWTNSPAREGLDDIDWTRVSGENSRLSPGKDHTSYSPKGYVMTPMRSTVQRPGDRAWLVSRPFNASQSNVDTRCLTFWYFMNEPIVDPAGPGLGSLRVYVRKEDPNVLGSPASAIFSRYSVIWRLHNHQGGVWRLARAQIQQSINYRVIIEGLWGSNRNTGSIAIDDISFYDGTCTTAPQEARPHEMECFFDKDTCSWRNLYNGTVMRPDVDWRLASASRRPANLQDHTFGAPSGYIYFDVFSQQGRVDIIRLVGPNITTGGIGRPRLCMTFWFAAFGAGETTQLKIYAVDTKLKDQKEIWALRVNQLEATRPDWNFAQVELETNETDPAGQEVNIVFEGRASNGGFAIDDILVYEGTCRSRPAFATPS